MIARTGQASKVTGRNNRSVSSANDHTKGGLLSGQFSHKETKYLERCSMSSITGKGCIFRFEFRDYSENQLKPVE